MSVGGGSRPATLYDSTCTVQGKTAFEPQNPGFEAKMGAYYNGVGAEPSKQINFVHKVGYIGSDSIGDIRTTVNGQQMTMNCNKKQSNLDGLAAKYYKSCNFAHRGLWAFNPGA